MPRAAKIPTTMRLKSRIQCPGGADTPAAEAPMVAATPADEHRRVEGQAREGPGRARAKTDTLGPATKVAQRAEGRGGLVQGRLEGSVRHALAELRRSSGVAPHAGAEQQQRAGDGAEERCIEAGEGRRGRRPRRLSERRRAWGATGACGRARSGRAYAGSDGLLRRFVDIRLRVRSVNCPLSARSR